MEFLGAWNFIVSDVYLDSLQLLPERIAPAESAE